MTFVQYLLVLMKQRLQELEVDRYRGFLSKAIYNRYIKAGAPRQVNIPSKTLRELTEVECQLSPSNHPTHPNKVVVLNHHPTLTL